MSVEAMQQVPSIGRIVHYVLDGGFSKGQHRPAIIVRTWGDTVESSVQLQVFTDGRNDDYNWYRDVPTWKTSVSHDPTGTIPGTYHFPEYVPSVGA